MAAYLCVRARTHRHTHTLSLSLTHTHTHTSVPTLLSGPSQVHTYIATPGGRTSYLSELRSGHSVAVVGTDGRVRTALVRAWFKYQPMQGVCLEWP